LPREWIYTLILDYLEIFKETLAQSTRLISFLQTFSSEHLCKVSTLDSSMFDLNSAVNRVNYLMELLSDKRRRTKHPIYKGNFSHEGDLLTSRNEDLDKLMLIYNSLSDRQNTIILSPVTKEHGWEIIREMEDLRSMWRVTFPTYRIKKWISIIIF
jgi:hypothetical protein